MIHTSGANMIKYFVDNTMCTTVHRYFESADDQYKHVATTLSSHEIGNVFFAVGQSKEWVHELNNRGVVRYCVDMAHGDSKICVDAIKYIKSLNPNAIVMAGNVATHDGYVRLRQAGAEFIRVGIAGGSICSTAKNTAFGVPMMTSILDCAEAKKTFGGKLIADGGIRSAADMLKAIAGGADMVMCGKLIASTSLAEGPFYNKNDADVSTLGKRTNPSDLIPHYVEYGGMASHEMGMRNNSHKADSNTSIEGVFGMITYTGATKEVIESINANLKAGMSYCGSRTFEEFKTKAVMRKMSTAGIVEKETHLMTRMPK